MRNFKKSLFPTLTLLATSLSLAGCPGSPGQTETLETPTIVSVAPAWIADENHPTVNGTAEAGVDVVVYGTADCTGKELKKVTVEENSRFAAQIEVEDDTVTQLSARAVQGGAESECGTSPSAYREDSTDPAAPVAGALVPSSPSRNRNPMLSGTAEAESFVKVYATADCSGQAIGSGQADASGNFSFSIEPALGTTTLLRLQATDAAKNQSPCAAGPAYTHDETGPALPMNLSLSPAGPADQNTPTLFGTTEPGSLLTVFLGAGCDGEGYIAQIGGDGAFSLVIGAVADDSSTAIYVSMTDVLGNHSGCVDTGLVYVEDSTAPVKPSILAISPSNRANNNNPVIEGLSEPGATIELCAGDPCAALVPTAVAGSDGKFQITATVLDNSTNSFRFRAIDRANHASPYTGALPYIEDSSVLTAGLVFDESVKTPSTAQTFLVEVISEPDARTKIYLDPACTIELPEYSPRIPGSGPVPGNGPGTDPNDPSIPTPPDTPPDQFTTAWRIPLEDDQGPAQDPTNPTDPEPQPQPDLPDLTDGNMARIQVEPNTVNSFYTKSFDPFGNVSGCSSDALVYVHDNIPPHDFEASCVIQIQSSISFTGFVGFSGGIAEGDRFVVQRDSCAAGSPVLLDRLFSPEVPYTFNPGTFNIFLGYSVGVTVWDRAGNVAPCKVYQCPFRAF